MRTYTRVIFGLNALYQLAVGVIFLVVPATGVSLYGFPPADAGSAALMGALRGLGAAVLVGAAMSALIAREPDKDPVLLPVMGLLSALTLVAWAFTLANGEMAFAQAALDIVVQVLLLIAVAGYYSTAKRGSARGQAVAAV